MCLPARISVTALQRTDVTIINNKIAFICQHRVNRVVYVLNGFEEFGVARRDAEVTACAHFKVCFMCVFVF